MQLIFQLTNTNNDQFQRLIYMLRYSYLITGMKSISIIYTLILSSLCLQSADLVREVEFNDGTHLILTLKDQPLTFKRFLNNNEIENIKLNLSDTHELHFTTSQPVARLQQINALLEQLRDKSFKQREKAAAQLGSISNGFQNILKTNIENSLDPEVRWRLRRIISNLPPQSSLGFDQLRSKTKKLKGQIINFNSTTQYHGSEITLSRSSVKSIKEIPKIFNRSGYFIINEENSLAIPITNIKIDFNSSLEGKILRSGQNINKTYEGIGVSFKSLRPNSYLTVSPKQIEGIQQGNSATNHRPLFEGTISARFCDPDDPTKNRAVSFIGLRVGLVKPGGTTLTAFDSNNHKVEASTIREGNQFIGILSKTPITRFTINANSDIDTTFSFDDLIFTDLQNINEANGALLTLKNGDRISCERFIFPELFNRKEQNLIAFPSSKSLGKLNIKMNAILSIHNSELKDPDQTLIPHLWCLLNDGSILKVKYTPEMPPRTYLGSFPLLELKLNALWSSGKILNNHNNALTVPNNGAAILIRKDPVYVENFTINNDSFEGTRKDSSQVKYVFSRMPSIWFNNKLDQSQSIISLTLVDGQKIHCSKQSLFSIAKITESHVILQIDNDKKLLIPFDEIHSMEF
jgi:hypothetical protein